MRWTPLPRPNPCLPCVVGNPRKARCGPTVHVDMPGAHAASGRGRTVEVNANPDPAADTLRQEAKRYRALGQVEVARRYERFAQEIEREHRNPQYKYRGAGSPKWFSVHVGGQTLATGSKGHALLAIEAAMRSAAVHEVAVRDDRGDLAALFKRSPGRGWEQAVGRRWSWPPLANPDARRARPSDLPIRKVTTTSTTRTERSPQENPKLMVLNPADDALAAAATRKMGRPLTVREKTLLVQARRDFKTFHGREATAADLTKVDAPPGSPTILTMVGDLDRLDYTVPFASGRKGRWSHEGGDHGRARRTAKPKIAAVPGRKKHNYVIVEPRGATTYFKPTHGLMG